MANFAATQAITVHVNIETAVAALETALELVVNTSVIRTCSIIRLDSNKYAAVLVYTAAV